VSIFHAVGGQQIRLSCLVTNLDERRGIAKLNVYFDGQIASLGTTESKTEKMKNHYNTKVSVK